MRRRTPHPAGQNKNTPSIRAKPTERSVFYSSLTAGAPAHAQLARAADDKEDRPGDVHESPREYVDCAQEKIHTDQDHKDRDHFVMRAIARLTLHFMSVHFVESLMK